MCLCKKVLTCVNLALEQFFLTVGQNNFGNKIPFVGWGQIYLVFLPFKKNYRLPPPTFDNSK